MAIILGVKQSAKTYQFLQDTNNFSYLNSINSSNLLFLNVDENTNNNAVIRFKNNYEFGYINNKIAIKNVSNLIEIDNNAINLYKNTYMYCNLNVDNYFYTENNSTIFNNNIKLNFNNNIDNSFKIVNNNSELPIFEVFKNKINIRSPNVYASNIWLSSNSTLYTNFIDSPNDKPVVITNMSFAENLRIFSANIVQNISLDNDIVFTDLINNKPYAKNPFDILSEQEWNTYMVDNSINIKDPNFMLPNIYVCKYILPGTNIGGSNIAEFRTKIIGDNSSNSNLIFAINNKGYISIDNKYNSNIPLNINVLPTGSNIIQYTNINDSNNKCYCINSNGFINIGKLDFLPNQLNIFKNNNYDRNNTELISLNINNSNNTSNNENTKIIFNNNSNFTDFKFIFQSLTSSGNNITFDIIITNNYIINNIIPINSLIYENANNYGIYDIIPDIDRLLFNYIINPNIKYPINTLSIEFIERINNTIKYKIYPPSLALNPPTIPSSLFNKLIYNITIINVVITIEFYIYHSLYSYNYNGKYYPKLCNLISGKTNSNTIFEVSQQGNIGIGTNYTDNYKLYINENALINNIDCKYIDNYLTKKISICNCILNDIDIINANLIKSKKITSLNFETNDCLIYSNCFINSNLTILPNNGQFIVGTKSIFGLNTTQYPNYLITLNTSNNGNGLVINNNDVNNNPNILINSSCEFSYPYVRLKTLTNSYNLILSNNNFEINDTINKNKLFENNSNNNSISLLNNCFNIFKDTSGNIKFYAGCLTASADWYGTTISRLGTNTEKKSSFNIYGDFNVYNIVNRPIISCFNDNFNKVKIGFGTDVETYISDTNAQYDNNDLIINYNTLFSSNITVMENIYLSGTLLSISDCNLKTNIKKIENPLNKIQLISGYTYTRTDTGNMETGLIAQEVLNILPEVISYNLNNNYTISYGNMCGILVECIKELNEKINVLETKLKTK
jgi:hypothetical protein